MSSKIRNILETVQEREIIKTAPDMVVYLDGSPTLFNKYLDVSQAQDAPIVLNFNDHVTSISGAMDVENLVPGVQINLSVPNDKKYLYMAPGGNHIIEAMMEVQIFCKGYYLSTNQNSVYRRIFKGLVSHASYNDNGKTLEIGLSCYGAMQFLDLMQVDLNPAVDSNSPNGPIPYTSIQANMHPLQMIKDMLTRSLTTEGFQKNSLNQTKVVQGPYAQSIQNAYITKWQTILNSINADVHIFGLPTPNDPLGDPATKLSDQHGSKDPKLGSLAPAVVGKQREVDGYIGLQLNKIRENQPDMGVSAIQLLNGRITSRLERFRAMISTIGFEGYQDIDGSIIVKPPLFNLDVTNIGTSGSSGVPAAVDIYDANNPFIINLAEIETEQETEDQAGIKATRMTVRGPFTTSMQIEGTEQLQYVSDYIDIKLLQQFGLREEPAKFVGYLRDGDKRFGFALAVNELVRSNRGYRTYSCRIPMRPELKLGFPCFIPHRDMYGYLRGVSFSYVVGGACTMDLSMDMIRRRPVFPTKHASDQGDNSITNNTIVYTSAPNLVNQLTKYTPPTTPLAGSSSDYNAAGSFLFGDNASADLAGQPSTMLMDPSLSPSDDQIKVQNNLLNRLQISQQIGPDTTSTAWRIQADSGNFSTQKPCDDVYLDLLKKVQPFTDAKGYEVVTPFPWGRWSTLKDAIQDMTRSGYVVPTTAPNPISLPAVQSFLFAGVGTSTGNSDPSSALQKTLSDLGATVGNNTVFELTYPSDSSQQNDGVLTMQGTSDAASIAELQNDISKRVQVFVSGGAKPISNLTAALTSTINPTGGAKPGIASSLQNVVASLKGLVS